MLEAAERKGVLLALGGFCLWGVFPLYFVLLAEVRASEVLAHRILWSVWLVGLLLLLQGGWRNMLGSMRRLRRWGFYTITGVLVSLNWLIYIWAAQNGHVIDASLGYFINPLISVVLAMTFLGERLTRPQWLAVMLACVGVAVLVVRFGAIPWIALSIALTFSGYSLLRKKAGLPAMEGLFVETALAAPFALAWLVYLNELGQLAFGAVAASTSVLLGFAGVVTVMPLALYLSSLKHLKLSSVGILQYITPTLQFTCGLLLGEPFGFYQGVAFGLIWAALGIFTWDAFRGADAKPRHVYRSAR